MKLLQNEPFDINEYCGQMVLTYFSEDSAIADGLYATLTTAGYACVKKELSFHNVIKSAYVAGVDEMLKTCGCYLLIVTEHFFKSEYRALRNHVWYQVGHLQAIRREAVVPFAPVGVSIDLAATPIGRCNVIRTEEELLRTFASNFRRTLSKNAFFAENELNRYAGKRLDYRKMIIRFDITREDFEEAMAEYIEEAGVGCMDDAAFETVLRDDIECCAKLLAFGSENALNAQLMPYRGEMSPLPVDYPVTYTCNRHYSRKREGEATFAEYLFELVMPIHRLFGVNFKPFLRTHGDLTPDILRILFDSNFVEGTDPHVTGDRLYFSLNFPNAKAFSFDRSLDIGESADYLYPQ